MNDLAEAFSVAAQPLTEQMSRFARAADRLNLALMRCSPEVKARIQRDLRAAARRRETDNVCRQVRAEARIIVDRDLADWIDYGNRQP
jgi:hypothetical protein